MRRLSIFLLACLFLFVFDVQAGKKKTKPSKRQEVGDAIHKLKSPNPEEVMYAVQILAASGAKAAIGPLTDLLRSGPRNDVTNGIIQALGSISNKGSIELLMEYLSHRRPDARVAAIYALENYDDKRVTKAHQGACG